MLSPAEQTWCRAGWGAMGFLMAGDRKFIIVLQDPRLCLFGLSCQPDGKPLALLPS